MNDNMARQLSFLACGSTALSVALFILYERYFAEIRPVGGASSTSIWQFEAAVLVESILFVSVAIAGLSLIGAISFISRRSRRR